jgi:hypothetical protein
MTHGLIALGIILPGMVRMEDGTGVGVVFTPVFTTLGSILGAHPGDIMEVTMGDIMEDIMDTPTTITTLTAIRDIIPTVHQGARMPAEGVQVRTATTTGFRREVLAVTHHPVVRLP